MQHLYAPKITDNRVVELFNLVTRRTKWVNFSIKIP